MSESRSFRGYLRPDGAAGVRNELLVLSITGLTGPTARRIGQAIRGAKVVTMPYGSGLVGEDRAVHYRALAGMGRHPNVGAALVIGGDGPKVEDIGARIAESGKPVETLVLDDCGHDCLTLTDRGLRIGARLARDISRQRREELPLSKLFMAAECGRSDPSSGLVSNPLVGRILDRVVDAGGRAVFGETTEWLGAEHLLEKRAAEPKVAEAVLAAAHRREQLAIDGGVDLTGNNPGPTNIAAGLSSIEEKSLGAIMKGGSRPIRGVLGIAEAPPGPGLYVMDAPAYAPESLTGMVTAGAQMALFTTGPGNSFVSALAPTLKISANPETVARLHDQIDFDASPVFQGKRTLDEAAEELFERVLEVASGSATWGEILIEGEEVVSRLGAAL